MFRRWRIGIDPSQLFTWRRHARLKAEASVDTARSDCSTVDTIIGDAVIRVDVVIDERQADPRGALSMIPSAAALQAHRSSWTSLDRG